MKQKENESHEALWKDIVSAALRSFGNESARVKKINSAILKINKAVESGNRDQIICTNLEVCCEFPEIVFASDSGIVPVHRDFMDVQPYCVQIESLRAIGKALHCSKLNEKVLHALEEGGKVALERLIEKGVDGLFGKINGMWRSKGI